MASARITKRKTKRGLRWDVKYRLGGRGSADLGKTFKTRAEAQAFAAQITLDVVRKTDSPLLHEAFESFKRVKRTEGVAASSFDHYEYRFKHLKDLERLPLSEITPATINTHYERLRKRGVSQNELHQVRILLSGIFQVAINEETYEGENPVLRSAKITRPKPKEGAVALAPDVIKRIADQMDDENQTIFWMIAQLGVRKGELAALRPDDFSEDFSEVRITRSLSKGREGPTKTPKSTRTLAIPKNLQERLRKMKPQPNGRMFNFPDKWGEDRLAPACKAAGTKRLTIHNLRDLAAGTLIRAGQDQASVSRQLGHADPNITGQRYIASLDDASRNAAEKMDEIFGEGPKAKAKKPSKKAK